MGIIAFEMLTEATPFTSDNVHKTYAEILSYADSRSAKPMKYPNDLEVSDALRDLIDGLITGMDSRLTYDRIKRHRFFNGVDWKNIRGQVPPIIPVNTTNCLLLCYSSMLNLFKLQLISLSLTL